MCLHSSFHRVQDHQCSEVLSEGDAFPSPAVPPFLLLSTASPALFLSLALPGRGEVYLRADFPSRSWLLSSAKDCVWDVPFWSGMPLSPVAALVCSCTLLLHCDLLSCSFLLSLCLLLRVNVIVGGNPAPRWQSLQFCCCSFSVCETVKFSLSVCYLTPSLKACSCFFALCLWPEYDCDLGFNKENVLWNFVVYIFLAMPMKTACGWIYHS